MKPSESFTKKSENVTTNMEWGRGGEQGRREKNERALGRGEDGILVSVPVRKLIILPEKKKKKKRET